DLWDRRREKVGTWSRGMKQKLAVARALMHRPALLFLDEPTDGLDPVAAAALRDDLAAMASRDGVTLFLTTHNLAEAERLCQRVAVIRAGKLLAVGHPDELSAGTAGQRVEVAGQGFTDEVLALLRRQAAVAGVDMDAGRLVIHLRQPAPAAPLVRLLVEQGADVEEVSKDRVSLEEAFLDLVRDPS
ncbi:MAG: AAA family ATPase, partial [Chloroflexota bacterium]